MEPNVEHYQYLADVYQLFFRDFEESMREEGEWLTSILKPPAVRSVLDASCGTGRQAIPLAQAGFAVTAADPSPAMQLVARRQAAEHGVSIEWLLSDFESLPRHVRGRFDAVIALGNGLCHCLAREAVVRALAALQECCAPSAVCLVGIKDFDRIRQEHVMSLACEGIEEGSTRAHLTQSWAHEDPVLVCSTTLWRRDGDTGRLRSAIRAQTREYMLGEAEMHEAGLEAGFQSVTRIDHPGEAVYLLQA
jgi:SAM-dependent methyltransferase